MSLISITAGMAIALQSAMSGQLSSIIKSPLWASFMIYSSSTLVMTIYLLFSKTNFPSFYSIKSVPGHLWILGAVLSVSALTMVYWQMPKIGVARVMSGVLTGQLIISIVASHYGWFNLPVTTLTISRTIGVTFMFVGVFLINGRSF